MKEAKAKFKKSGLPFKEFTDYVESVFGPNITDWVAPLIGWSQLRVRWAWASLIEWQSCVRFQSMAEKEIRQIHLLEKKIRLQYINFYLYRSKFSTKH